MPVKIGDKVEIIQSSIVSLPNYCLVRKICIDCRQEKQRRSQSFVLSSDEVGADENGCDNHFEDRQKSNNSKIIDKLNPSNNNTKNNNQLHYCSVQEGLIPISVLSCLQLQSSFSSNHHPIIQNTSSASSSSLAATTMSFHQSTNEYRGELFSLN